MLMITHDLRANRHADVALKPSPLDETTRRTLGRSLATFQLGESGTGEHLFAAADAEGVSPDYDRALRAFIAEEQEHARMLELVLAAIEQPTRDSHWTDRVFVLIRRLKSLRTEVLTLLVAELIAIRYYGALATMSGDPAIAAVCGRIRDDEIRHVDFHAETLPVHLRRFPKPVHLLVRGLWNALVTGASVMVALDHRRALRIGGVGTRQFVVDVSRLRADLDRRLFT
jgi:hypothetical protein